MTSIDLTSRPTVDLFTDGACLGNPGPGGWAYILRHPASGKKKVEADGEAGTTNNRMELTAVIRGLGALKGPSTVTLHSDSKYVVDGVTTWMAGWQRHGWRKTANARDLVKNADLWQRIWDHARTHQIKAEWVRGHNGHPENEECDRLATAAAAKAAEGRP